MECRSFVLILSCVLLTACASREQIVARKAETEQAAQVKREEHCALFGYKRGTSDYSHCLENLYVQDQQQLAAKEAGDAARVQRVGNSLQQAGAAMSAISQPPPMEPMRQPVRCNTIGTTTTCY
jgi:hypothetical protein